MTLTNLRSRLHTISLLSWNRFPARNAQKNENDPSAYFGPLRDKYWSSSDYVYNNWKSLQNFSRNLGESRANKIASRAILWWTFAQEWLFSYKGRDEQFYGWPYWFFWKNRKLPLDTHLCSSSDMGCSWILKNKHACETVGLLFLPTFHCGRYQVESTRWMFILMTPVLYHWLSSWEGAKRWYGCHQVSLG